jgi:subtilisin family serine protease
VDAGAAIVNVSLGGYATSSVLSDAVDYAVAANVAVVASAGNDQAAQLVWPAAYSGVVSVGAVDGVGRQAIFSNSGASLQLTAPGYAIRTVGAGGSRVLFSGTSASAPVVSGAIAALLSTTPGLTAVQAADLLATYSTDAGPAGPDPDYGRGTLNLDRALNRGKTSGSVTKKP